MNRLKIFVVFIFFISLSVCAFGQEVNLKIHFIDVGEGDAILIESDNGRACLIDTGNLISGFRVAKYLQKQGIQDLGHLIFTHPDFDHIGGAFFILQMYNVKNIYDNGQDLTELAKYSDIYRWYEELVRKDKNYKTLKAKDTISLGRVILKVLWPPQSSYLADYNANSLVIMLEYGKFRCLLTGDLTVAAERKILEQDTDLKANVLKVGHHGAKDASCEEFLRKTSPEIGIISVNTQNIRGYPDKEIIDRIKRIGISLYRTDKDGDILLEIRQLKDGKFKMNVKKNKGLL